MFAYDPTLSYLQVAPGAIIALYHSVNSTQVSMPGVANANARAVICGYKQGTGFGVAIALHLVDDGRHIIYTNDAGVLDGDGARTAAQEAIQFSESMGFFVENAQWRQLDAVVQAETVAQLKVFQPPVDTKKADVTKSVDPRLKLARLLAQF